MFKMLKSKYLVVTMTLLLIVSMMPMLAFATNEPQADKKEVTTEETIDSPQEQADETEKANEQAAEKEKPKEEGSNEAKQDSAIQKQNVENKSLEKLIEKLPDESKITKSNMKDVQDLIDEINSIAVKLSFEELDKYDISKVFSAIEKISYLEDQANGKYMQKARRNAPKKAQARSAEVISGTVVSVKNLANNKNVWGQFDINPDDKTTKIFGICGARGQHGHASVGNRITMTQEPQNSDLAKLCYLASFKQGDMNYLYLVSCAASYLNGLSPQYINKVPNSKKLLKEIKKIDKVPDNFQVFSGMPSNGTQWIVGWRYQDTGLVKIKKVSANQDPDFYDKLCPNNYTLKGAVYGLYKTSDDAQKNINKVHEFVTDEKGNTEEFKVSVGAYYIKEIKPSKGYLLDASAQIPQLIRVTANQSSLYTSNEQPDADPMPIRIEKINTINPGSTKGLEGAEYTYRYYDVDPAVYTSSESLKDVKPTRSWTIKTMLEPDPDPARAAKGYKVAIARFDDKHFVSGDEFYRHSDNTTRIPLGVFTIEETNAPRDFARDTNIYYGKVTQDPKTFEAVETLEGKTGTFELNKGDGTQFENPQRIELVIQKINAETLPEGVTNHGTLEEAEYDIYALDASTKESKIKVAHAVTDKDGKAVVTKADNGDILHPNTYYIKETKAPNGYTLDMGDNGKDGFRKIECPIKEKNVEVFRYTVNSPEKPTITKIHKTDISKGVKELKGAKLQVIDANGKAVDEWTSEDKPHDIIGLHNGKYILREIEAPYGYETANDVEFTISNDKVLTEVSMDNKPIEMKTTANADSTKSHTGTYSKTEKIIDKVSYKNLVKGREYTVTGTLMDKKTGKEFLDKDGNKITSSKTFVAEDVNGTVEIEFVFDASEIEKGSSIVAFEKLYKDGKEIQVHEDINDENQTVGYPKIGTKMNPEKNSLSDIVSYKNLSTNRVYKLKGWLVDKKTGKVKDGSIGVTFFKIDSNGKVVYLLTEPKKAKFNEDTILAKGDVKMRFPIGIEKVAGTTVTAFEELSIYSETKDGKLTETLIAEHKDINSADQTISIGRIEIDDKDIFGGIATGDDVPFIFIVFLITSFAASAITISYIVRKRKNEKNI